MKDKQEILNAIAVPLLDWYGKNKRVLPWRGTKNPYKVWVSEIMLQQTRVAAVIPYYLRWMEELPDIASLASVDSEQLMKLWQGLGYYSRARNMRKAAEMLVNDYGGRFPESIAELRKLPGIGDYTAGAIASIAFNQPVPAVDGNVLRVAARTAGIQEDIMDTGVRKKFRELMERAVPQDRPGEFNQALMDLGAVVCLPNGAPDCANCPLAISGICEAERLGLQGILPVRSKKAKRRIEEMTVYLLIKDGQAALRKRPEQGLLAGLWEFPHVPGALSEEEAAVLPEEWGLTPSAWRKKIPARHIFSHVEWHMTGYLLDVKDVKNAKNGNINEENNGFVWAGRARLEELAVPSAFGKYLAEMLGILEE